MSYEGQVVGEPRTTKWAARWRVESFNPEEDAQRLLREAECEGIALHIGKVAPLKEVHKTYRQMNGGPWETHPVEVVRRPGALVVGLISTRTSSTVLRLQRTLFNAWLTPRTETSDSTDRDWEKLRQAWTRAGLSEPEYQGSDVVPASDIKSASPSENDPESPSK